MRKGRDPRDIVYALAWTRVTMYIAAGLFAVMIMLGSWGCVTQPQSFNDQAGAVALSITTSAVTVEQLCAAATKGGPCTGTLETRQRDQARDALQQAQRFLEEAVAVQSTDKLAQARAVLAIAQRIVEEQQP